MDKDQSARAADIAGKTLGTLVNHMLETFLTTGEKAMSAKAMSDPHMLGLDAGFGCGFIWLFA